MNGQTRMLLDNIWNADSKESALFKNSCAWTNFWSRQSSTSNESKIKYFCGWNILKYLNILVIGENQPTLLVLDMGVFAKQVYMNQPNEYELARSLNKKKERFKCTASPDIPMKNRKLSIIRTLKNSLLAGSIHVPPLKQKKCCLLAVAP